MKTHLFGNAASPSVNMQDKFRYKAKFFICVSEVVICCCSNLFNQLITIDHICLSHHLLPVDPLMHLGAWQLFRFSIDPDYDDPINLSLF